MLPDQTENELIHLRNEVALQYAEIVALRTRLNRHACQCPQPVVAERGGSHAYCETCQGYITARYIRTLQTLMGDEHGQQSE